MVMAPFHREVAWWIIKALMIRQRGGEGMSLRRRLESRGIFGEPPRLKGQPAPEGQFAPGREICRKIR